MELIIKNLGTGIIETRGNNLAVDLTITKFSDITNIIIPFFDKNNVLGVKQLDYQDWWKVAKLMIEESPTPGLNLIRTIKSGMNKGR